MAQNLLVTGATGALAGALPRDSLDAQQAAPQRIIATTRRPKALRAFGALGVSIRRADVDEPVEASASAFRGAARLLLVSTNAPSGTRLAQQRRAIEAAVQAGVGQVVYMSILQPDEGSPVRVAPDQRGTEQALAFAGAAWTVLRHGRHAAHLLHVLPTAIAAGTWTTAERAWNCEQIASLAGWLCGRSLAMRQADAVSLHAGLLQAGLSEVVADLRTALDVCATLGRAARTGRALLALTGRPPQPLDEFLRHHREQLLPT